MYIYIYIHILHNRQVDRQLSNLGGFCQGFREPLFYTSRAPVFSEVHNQMSFVNLKNPCHAGLEFPMDATTPTSSSRSVGQGLGNLRKTKALSLVAEIAPNFDACNHQSGRRLNVSSCNGCIV
ncbi:hypothetical protein AAMO2058_001050100 [Amorphochlora amoebiformis]